MRTTVNLDDDIYEAARALAAAQNQSLGAVLSRLARRGLAPTAGTRKRARGGFPVVALPPRSPAVTSASVRRALDEDA